MKKSKKAKKKAPKSDEMLNNMLIEAVSENKIEEVKKALKKGANVNVITKNTTPLLIASGYAGYTEIARILIDQGADVNLRKKRDDETPLTYASMYGHLEIVKMLLNAGADVNMQGGCGRTPIMYAASHGNEPKYKEIIKLLLQKGADPNIRNQADDNALLEILWKEDVDPETVQLLIDHGLDINFKSEKYYSVTALMRAADLGHLGAVKVLLKNGADIHIKSGDKETAEPP